LILAILNAITPTTFADYKAIKKALNVTLDPMLAAGAIIVTNQDGFQYLDTLEDGTGKPVLQVDVTQPTQKLFAGKPVKVISNTVLTTSGTTTKLAPMFVGNLSEAITMFERQGYQIASTNIGGTAFRKDRTELRVIELEDVVSVDSSAAVFGKIDVTSVV
jgi:HK97 family phage major capsid protein